MIPLPAAASAAVIAHRGGLWPDCEENSLAAFERAAQAGLQWAETDVHASADGVLYAVHDPSLKRTAGVAALIEQLSSARLDRLRLLDGSRVPRLVDVLEAAPSLSFNVDVKADSGTEPMIRLAREPRLCKRLRLASFSARRLRRLRAAVPGVRTSAGTGEIALAAAGGMRALDERIDCLQVPEARAGIRVVTPRLIAAAHRTGRQVHVWTVNAAAQMERLAALGVDAIVTDDVELGLRAFARGPRPH